MVPPFGALLLLPFCVFGVPLAAPGATLGFLCVFFLLGALGPLWCALGCYGEHHVREGVCARVAFSACVFLGGDVPPHVVVAGGRFRNDPGYPPSVVVLRGVTPPPDVHMRKTLLGL